MTITVEFTSASEKWLRITDNLLVNAEPQRQLVNPQKPFAIKLSTIGNSTMGEVKVEVSRDDKTYAPHAEAMPVTPASHAIDDSKLPPPKNQPPAAPPAERQAKPPG